MYYEIVFFLGMLKRKTIMDIFLLSSKSERSLKPSVSNNWKIRKTYCFVVFVGNNVTYSLQHASWAELARWEGGRRAGGYVC